MPCEADAAARDAAWLLDMLTAARAVVAFVKNRTPEQYDQELFSAPRSSVKSRSSAKPPAGFHKRSRQTIRRSRAGRSSRSGTVFPRVRQIDNRLIWTVATVHVPALIGQLEKIVTPPAADG